jgi:hypothetical protein
MVNAPKSIQTVRLSIPITVRRSLKWIGQGVLKLERDMWNGRMDSRTLVYHNTSRLKDGSIKMKNTNELWFHFKLRIVIGIDSLMVCILFGEISMFHSRVMGLYSSNCRRFFVCRTVNWEPLGQFTSNFAQLLELIVNNYAKFEVNSPRGSQFTAWHTKNHLQFDE